MGIACIAAYDYDADVFRVFCEDNLGAFAELAERVDVVAGYNNRRFDNPLVAAHGVHISDKKSYDLYKEIYAAHGYKPADRVRGLKLGDCARANLNGQDKSEDGAMAPVLWQQGQIGRVIDYCMRDVALTRDLLDLVMEGRFVSPKTRRRLKVRPPK
jgi:DEAD/DEAH box helicase domain-containing protein